MTNSDTTICVGIDVSKAHVDVGIGGQDRVRRFPNDGPGLRAALDWLAPHPVALVVMEATGRLHEHAAHLLRAEGLAVAVINPARARHFARAKGRLSKTDRPRRVEWMP